MRPAHRRHPLRAPQRLVQLPHDRVRRGRPAGPAHPPHPAERAARESRWKTLAALLGEIPGTVPQGRDPRCEINPHYMAMFTLDPQVHPGLDRDLVVRALVAEGLPAFVNYPPVYRTEAFRSVPGPGTEELAERNPVGELLGRRGIWLHHRVLLGTDDDCADVAEALSKVLTGLTAQRNPV
ncbi:DegT/DnrJ/EryC1/StrS family aminotransferase [Streptomyces dangxiongensis]|uniref:DegT/DnrJ/EryC1/StrS family aminotransferase n=1 Tax=Streptomyces dangxiongensis TaxID=1442032 RepID=UPI0030B82443